MSDFFLENTLSILLTAGTLFSFIWLVYHRNALKINLFISFVLAVLHTFTGLLCVKVFAVLETMDFSKIESMSLFGAIFFLPAVYWLGGKIGNRSIPMVFDVFTPCVVFTLLCARINCIFSNCCLGRYIPGTNGMRFPTRELEIIFYIILLFYFGYQERQKRVPGLLYPEYMIAYGTFRFITEGFREADSQAMIHISHIWAIVILCLGYSIYFEIKKKGRGRNVKKSK